MRMSNDLNPMKMFVRNCNRLMEMNGTGILEATDI